METKNMDTMSIFFGCDEFQRLKYSLNKKEKVNEKIDALEMIYPKLNNECEKNK
ncbi:MAG: hypothetical protein ACFFDF_16075 [Candidatus Odinarchaeota archaeon]